jgi:hypothetical protein
MDDNANDQGRMPEQSNDAQRPQVDQQNQQGQPRGPEQQPDNPQQNAPGQQNQQGERDPRRGVDDEGSDETDIDDGLSGGIDGGQLEPGRGRQEGFEG